MEIIFDKYVAFYLTEVSEFSMDRWPDFKVT